MPATAIATPTAPPTQPPTIAGTSKLGYATPGLITTTPVLTLALIVTFYLLIVAYQRAMLNEQLEFMLIILTEFT